MPRTALVFWYGAILMYAVAAFRLWSTGLYRRYWVLTSWISFSAIALGILRSIPWTSPAYKSVYAVTCLLLIFLESATILELYFQLCGCHRNFRMPGMIVLGFLGALGLTCSAAIRLAWVPLDWKGTWQAVLLLARHCDAAMAIILFGSWVLLRIPGNPLRPSAVRAMWIVTLHSVYGWAVATATIAQTGRWQWWRLVLPVFGAAITGGMFSALLTRESDYLKLAPEPHPQELRAAQIAAIEAEVELEEGVRLFQRALEK